jgi:hypothetical protein
MSIESCVTYPANSIFLMVRDPLISICKLLVGGEADKMTAAPDPQAAAVILHKFIFWTDNKLSTQHQKRYQDAAAATEGEAKQHDNGLWIYKDYDELKIDLMDLFGRNKIIDNVQWLVSAGYLKRRTNPRYRWDKTLQYLVDIDLVQSQIDALPKFNSKLSSVPNQTNESGKNKRAIPKKTTEKTKEEEKKTTSAPAIAAQSAPINQPISSLPINGNESSARADNSAKRLQNATATTPPPSPTPSAPAPEMVNVPPALTAADGTETGKAKKERKVNEGYELGIALGDAWGIPPAKSEINLYIKQAKALALDVPVEEFKMFCDWRKADAGDWAKNLTIKTLLGSGHVSKYLQERDALKQQEEAHKRLLETIPADMLPRIVPMEQRASQEQIDAALAKFRTPIFTSSDSGEKIS